jgi:predicted adenylyl cyclase CyaB
MAENIEIKAKSSDFRKQKELAAGISDSPPEIIRQEDTFFHVPKGRLKLRILSDGSGEIIHYERPASKNPRPCKYHIVRIHDPESLKPVLASALGEEGTVRKIRTLYLFGQTRIHLDRVEDLGEFIELEYVLKNDADRTRGHREIEHLMELLKIHNDDLIGRPYIDLMKQYISTG